MPRDLIANGKLTYNLLCIMTLLAQTTAQVTITEHLNNLSLILNDSLNTKASRTAHNPVEP